MSVVVGFIVRPPSEMLSNSQTTLFILLELICKKKVQDFNTSFQCNLGVIIMKNRLFLVIHGLLNCKTIVLRCQNNVFDH